MRLGDIVHVNSRSKMAKYIRPSTQKKGEKPTWGTHTEVAVSDKSILGAVWRVRETLLENYNPSADIVITRPTTFNANTNGVYKRAIKYKGRRYGWHKLVVHWLDHIFGDIYFFRRILFLNIYPICSWIPEAIYWKEFKYSFGVPLGSASPDDIADHCAKGVHKGTWKIVWASSKRAREEFLASVEV